MGDSLIIRGAREHNLRNVSVELPRDQMIVFTGISGSGKSSLAFDTIFAEGQRRYVESLSSYARQFLGQMDKPDVDFLEGLSPAISIDQKSSSRNPRSTVGTITEIYDYLRLLYARIGVQHDPDTGEVVQRQTTQQIVDRVLGLAPGTRFEVLAPVVRSRKGDYHTLLGDLVKQGYVRARVDGEVIELGDPEEIERLDRYVNHDIEVVVDRLVMRDGIEQRLTESMEAALKLAEGHAWIHVVPAKAAAAGTASGKATTSAKATSTKAATKKGASSGKTTSSGKAAAKKPLQKAGDKEGDVMITYSQHLYSPSTGKSFEEPAPRNFSFNSPYGACQTCDGLGTRFEVDPQLVVPNPNLSVIDGAIAPWAGPTHRWYGRLLQAAAELHDILLDTPWRKLPKKHQNIFLYGRASGEGNGRSASTKMADQSALAGDRITVRYRNRYNRSRSYSTNFEGVIPSLRRRYAQTDSDSARTKIEGYMRAVPCGTCRGARLNVTSLAVRVAGLNIFEFCSASIGEAAKLVASLELTERESIISAPIIKEVESRLNFLLDVGLDYLTLNRSAVTLAGGEAQRLRLASQIGSGLEGVLYVLDEPSIGLHQRDNRRLIDTLQNLRNIGNTVLVVEHDQETINEADWVVDIGPGAGEHGGEIVYSGPVKGLAATKGSITGDYLAGRRAIPIPSERRVPNGEIVTVRNARENNLREIDVDFPLGCFVVVTGVSGSGKSTLVNEILYKALMQRIYGSKEVPGLHTELEGWGELDKVIEVDQSPIGRTPRSNPATYTGLFDHVRKLYALTNEAKTRGYQPGRFSFNVKGGRCEACSGDGTLRIEMHFLPDVYVPCEVCDGARYNRETLEVLFKGESISDVLNMSCEEALGFFSAQPPIVRHVQTMVDVGLGYIRLGQPATTLSGGEAQRVKLASELSKRSTGHTAYILDEPTTGLHFEDIRRLLEVLDRLVSNGNTVIVIEHNLDVIKTADWIIDLGPEGGEGGGTVVVEGPPEVVAATPGSHTGQFLKPLLAAG